MVKPKYSLSNVRSKCHSNAALPTVISTLIHIIYSKVPAQLLSSAHNKFHILKLLTFAAQAKVASTSFKRISTRKKRGRRLKTFKPRDKMFPASPLNVVSLTSYPHFFFSLSLSVSTGLTSRK
jgi:hypothetical protein